MMTNKKLEKLIGDIIKECLITEQEEPRLSSIPDKPMAPKELRAHLEKAKKRKERMDAQKKRAAIREPLRERGEFNPSLDTDDTGETDKEEALLLLQSLVPDVSKVMKTQKRLNALLGRLPQTSNVRGALEYHLEQYVVAAKAAFQKLK